MHRSEKRKFRDKITACALMFAISFFGFGAPVRAADDSGNTADAIKTATPIKHVIIIVGENRSFDHLFATYEPKNKKERVLNRLTQPPPVRSPFPGISPSGGPSTNREYAGTGSSQSQVLLLA